MPSPPQPLLLLSSRPWNEGLADRLCVALERPVHTIGKPAELQLEAVAALNPAWIFVPHWSQLIPETIWSHWPTVIQRGHSSTMLSDPPAPPRQRRGLRASRGWPDHHAASTPDPAVRAAAWRTG